MSIEVQLFYLFNDLAGKTAIVDGILIFFSTWLVWIMAGVSILLLWRLGKHERIKLLLALAGAVIITRIVSFILAIVFPRPRPFVDYVVHQLIAKSSGDLSFPSGHTSLAFALATFVFLLNRRAGVLLAVCAVLVGLGRIAVGVHYPSDVLAGAVIGVSGGIAASAAIRGLRVRPTTVK